MQDASLTASARRPLSAALDPDLPRLAASAALEADLAMKDPSAEIPFASLHKLLQRLQATKNSFIGQPNIANSVDPLSDDLLRQALLRSSSKSNAASMLQELKTVTQSISSSTGSSVGPFSPESLGGIRDFCIALSNYAAATAGNRHGASRRTSQYKR